MATHEVTSANFKEVLAQNSTVLIDFWATWCPPCRAFGPIFEKASETHTDMYFGKVDIDKSQDLAAAAGIQAVPTLLIARNGQVVYKQAGALRASDLETLISKVSALD